MKKTQLCNLHPPANCEHRIDGKMSFTILCGNYSLSESYKKCPYKQEAEIVLDSVQKQLSAIKTDEKCFGSAKNAHQWREERKNTK